MEVQSGSAFPEWNIYVELNGPWAGCRTFIMSVCHECVSLCMFIMNQSSCPSIYDITNVTQEYLWFQWIRTDIMFCVTPFI